MPTSDSVIWEKEKILLQLHRAMATGSPITIDLLREGPDVTDLGLIGLLEKSADAFGYDLSGITVLTHNLIQPYHSKINFHRSFPWHFVSNTKLKLCSAEDKKTFTKKFGLFIGRSNKHRLRLSAHVWKQHKEFTLQTFHWASNSDFHKENIGLQELVADGALNETHDAIEFLKQCPMLCDQVNGYPLLMDQHCEIAQVYHDFLIEIVCETYFSGETFFPTEKIWRPMIMRTPFIVQGPRYFLHRLKDLGFRTFDHWWDEGYAEDAASWQSTEIIKVIDHIARTPLKVLRHWYDEMQDTLDHNRSRLLTLTQDEISHLIKDCGE